MLTGEDVLDARIFDDASATAAPRSTSTTSRAARTTRMSAIREGKSYQVPYRMLAPRGVDEPAVAGRCVSADRVACGSIRQQAGCIVTGQGQASPPPSPAARR